MGERILLFAIAITAILLKVEAEDFSAGCSDEEEWRVVLGDVFYNETGQENVSLVRRIRFPEEDVYETKIDCITINDGTEDKSGGVVSIVEGGIDKYFVEIRLNSQVGKGLLYSLMVFGPKFRRT